MGADLIATVERKTSRGWVEVDGLRFPRRNERLTFWDWFKLRHYAARPFNFRSYRLFGFLANVRNYDGVPSLGNPRGMPCNSPGFFIPGPESDLRDPSWVSLTELLQVDYDAPFQGMGQLRMKPTTLRQCLRPEYFTDLKILAAVGQPENVRIVFYFV